MDRTLRGRVTRVEVDGVFVEVPRLGLGVEFGPCQRLVPVVSGDEVLVSTVAGVKDDLVVLGRLE